MELEIEGMSELKEKLSPENLIMKPIKDLLGKAALVLEALAKQKATGRPGPKVQTGRLRASLTHTIDSASPPLWAKVGTPVEYAPYVEYGHAQHPGQFVPILEARLVQSESPAYPFLNPAYEESKDRIEGLLGEAKEIIESEWKK